MAAWPMPGEETPRMHTDRAFHVVVSGQTAIFGSSVDHLLRALDTRSGATRWRFFADGAIRFAPWIDQGRVYFGADDGYVYCLQLSDGSLIWKHRPSPDDERVIGNSRMVSLWPVRTGVIVDAGTVYVGAGVFPYEGLYICALDAATGREIWMNDTAGDLAWGLEYGGMTAQGYLLASDSTLYVPSGRGMPAAFNRMNGEFVRFLSQGSKTGGSWALLDRGQLIAGVNTQGTPAKIAYDTKTGNKQGDLFAHYPGVDLILTDAIAYSATETGIVAIDRQAHKDAVAETAQITSEEKILNEQLREVREEYDKLRILHTDLEEHATPETEAALMENSASIKSAQARQINLSSQLVHLAERKLALIKDPVKWRLERAGISTLALTGNTLVGGGQDFLLAMDRNTGNLGTEHTVDGLVLGLSLADSRVFASTDEGGIYCFADVSGGPAKIIREPRVTDPFPSDGVSTRYRAAAEAIVKSYGTPKGWCLVLDAGKGRLAYELAQRTDLNIVAIEKDAQQVDIARRRLLEAGLYGTRIICTTWDPSQLPDYFANLVVSDGGILQKPVEIPPQEIHRLLRPAGGMVLFENAEERAPGYLKKTAFSASDINPAPVPEEIPGHWVKFLRGKLEGAGSWNGLYADAANTGSSPDYLVRDPLGVLWYGEPGSEHMLERHARTVSPLAINGRLFVQGMEMVMGYDAYNGTSLWQRRIPGAVRARVDVDGSNIFADDQHLYVAAHDRTFQLDAQTGTTQQTFQTPRGPGDTPRRWGYLSIEDGILFGSAASTLEVEYGAVWNAMVIGSKWKSDENIPQEIHALTARNKKSVVEHFKEKYPEPNALAYAEFKRDGYHWRYLAAFPSWAPDHQPSPVSEKMMISESVFAYDIKTGRLLWEHRGASIPQISMAIGEGKMFLVKSDLSEAEKKQAMEDRLTMIQTGVYSQHDEENLPLLQRDLRRVVAIDIHSGKEAWSRPMDLSGNGGNKLGAAYHDGRLLFFGHYSNHDQNQFVAGGLQWRRVTVLNASDGTTYWSKPLNYRRRPLVIGDTIVIEPRACSLTTGEIKMRRHPITGEEVEWEFLRPGHSCGVVTASPNSLFFRSFSAAIVNMDRDAGLELFGGTRPGCWNSMIPANGLLTLQEASAGCTCSYSLRTTVVMKHKAQKGDGEWTVFISNSPTKPVEHLAVNFGAPGDMRGKDGTMWFGYPRPDTSQGQGPFKNYGVKFTLNENKEARAIQRDYRGTTIEGSTQPWLFTSSLQNLQSLTIPILEESSEAATYRVRMGFIAENELKKGQRIFDIELQDQIVAKQFDPMAAAEGHGRAVFLEFHGLKVKKDLRLRLINNDPTGNLDTAPRIQCLEIVRENSSPKSVRDLNPLH
jgi:outer membrane protein assembly factor BamB